MDGLWIHGFEAKKPQIGTCQAFMTILTSPFFLEDVLPGVQDETPVFVRTKALWQ
jgi:hypothetical protein